MTFPRQVLLSVCSCLLVTGLLADDLYLRVIDVGQGESIVAKATDATGPHYLIYDAGVGHASAMRGLHAVIPVGSRVDLMVISHNDSDHLGAVKQIMDDYHVTRIIHPGDVRESDTYRHSAAAILHEVATDHC
jgi:beta-lactamase superfamily II metal-dependent hydrolase